LGIDDLSILNVSDDVFAHGIALYKKLERL
jgi:hypothetical protein